MNWYFLSVLFILIIYFFSGGGGGGRGGCKLYLLIRTLQIERKGLCSVDGILAQHVIYFSELHCLQTSALLCIYTVLHSKRVDFFLTLHVDLFWSIINRNSDFSYYF